VRSSRTPEQSLLLADRRVKETPRWPDAWIDRGDLLVTMKRYKEAIADYEKALFLTEESHAFDRKYILKKISDTKSLITE
jgi:tetratricopeptide (TPR) repeat protein